MFRPISEMTLQNNEWLDINQSVEDNPPYTPQINDDNHVDSEETDEEFDWFEPT